MEATTFFFECPLSGESPTTTVIDRRPASDPTISVLDSGAERGDGVFETFGVVKRNAQALDPHLERLKTSARLLDLPEPDIEELRRIVRTTAAMTGLIGEYSLKLVLTRGGPGTNGRPAAWIILSNMPDYGTARTEGLRVILLNKGYNSSLVEEEPWLLFGAKHLSYAQHMAALREARRRDSEEVVFTTADGLLLEGPTSTLVVRHGDRLLTPDPGLGILHGTTQRAIFAHFENLGLRGSYERIARDVLLDADAAWLVSSVRMSVPITHVDGVEIKRDPDLTEQFNAFLLNRG